MDTQSFITKDMFKNLVGCITVVEFFTETVKLLLGDIVQPYNLWIAFIFSIFVSLIRLFFSNEINIENIILALLNVIVIFLGSVGVYQSIIKQISKIL